MNIFFAREIFTKKGTAIDEPAEVRAIRESTGGSKWTLTAFMQWLDARQEARIAAAGGAPEKGRDADVLWKRLTDLVAKTILGAFYFLFESITEYFTNIMIF
jgi:hypothetical protein